MDTHSSSSRPIIKHDIYISYSNHHKVFARDLCERLSSFNYTVFFDDSDDIRPGGDFPAYILKATNTCRIALVIISQEFVTSKWPMIELCHLADRLSPRSPPGVPAGPFTIFPLFYNLSPAEMKTKENVEKWRKEWKVLEEQDGSNRISAAKCEHVVTKVLPSLNGIVRCPESEQGELSYVVDAVDRVFSIMDRPKFVIPYKEYVGLDRLCQVILDKYKALERPRSSTYDDQSRSIDPSILGMYGVPGSGKSTICNFLLDSMFDDFRGKMVRLELPTVLTGADDLSVKEQYAKLFSVLYPRMKDFSWMDLERLYRLLLGARTNHKMFLVMDNLSPYNYERYETIFRAIIRSAILGPGSRVILVAQSKAILEDLLVEVKYKYASMITEVPCLLEKEAKELMRNSYPSVKEDVLTSLLSKCSFQSSSVMYMPFVLEQIGVLLRIKDCNDVDELELLWKTVDQGKRDVINSLVDINFKHLPEDLQVLFFDIALFIIPVGYFKLSDAMPILCSMHGIANTFELELKIRQLMNRCALSVMDNEELRIHDIFTMYARGVPGNSASYVNQRLFGISDPIHTASRQYNPRTSPVSDSIIRLNCQSARTIQIDATYPFNDFNDDAQLGYLQGIHLYLEIGHPTIALLVRNFNRSVNSTLSLFGDVSSLVIWEMENMSISRSEINTCARLSTLARLELRNHNNTCMQSERGIFKSLFSHEKWKHAHSDQLAMVKGIVSSDCMRRLQVLILVNVGMPKFEFGKLCACQALEVLEVCDERLMSVTLRDYCAPKLRRIIIGHKCPDMHWPWRQRKWSWGPTLFSLTPLCPRKSSQLVLQVSENTCPKLQEVCVDGSFFDRVEVRGLLPSQLCHLAMAGGRRNELKPAYLIPSSLGSGIFKWLETLELSCTEVESLDFTQESYLVLKTVQLHRCADLTRLNIRAGCIPKLQHLMVGQCHKLQAFEGSGSLFNQELQMLTLNELPQLECDLMLGRDASKMGLGKTAVSRGPGVRMYSCSVTEEASEGMAYASLGGSTSVRGEAEPLAMAIPDRYIFLEGQFTRLSDVWLEDLQYLREIGGIRHLQNLETLEIRNLRDLRRVSGMWPSSIRSIKLCDCPELEEIPRLEHPSWLLRLTCIKCVRLQRVESASQSMKALEWLELVECESMEGFPVEEEEEEDKEEEILMRKWGRRRKEYPGRRIGCLSVWGSGFATGGLLCRWLRRADLGSPLFEAAAQGLLWRFVNKGARDAMDALSDYFSTLAETFEHADIPYLQDLLSLELASTTSLFSGLSFSKKDERLCRECITHKFPMISSLSRRKRDHQGIYDP